MVLINHLGSKSWFHNQKLKEKMGEISTYLLEEYKLDNGALVLMKLKESVRERKIIYED